MSDKSPKGIADQIVVGTQITFAIIMIILAVLFAFSPLYLGYDFSSSMDYDDETEYSVTFDEMISFNGNESNEPYSVNGDVYLYENELSEEETDILDDARKETVTFSKSNTPSLIENNQRIAVQSDSTVLVYDVDIDYKSSGAIKLMIGMLSIFLTLITGFIGLVIITVMIEYLTEEHNITM